MRILAILLLLVGATWAGPKRYLKAAKTAEEAVEIARTRGKLIFLTVIVDGDGENRMVVDAVFKDRAFLKIAKEFVIVYANKDDDHGQVRVKTKEGKRVARCADCPSITCTDHMFLAMNYARGFFPSSVARTPIHFVIDANEDVVATIMNGSFEQGFNHVPAKQVVAKLKKILAKHGRGLSEQEYKNLKSYLIDAKAARARGKTTRELEILAKAVAFKKDVEGVLIARKRIQEIDKKAAKELERVDPLVEEKKWEEALDFLANIKTTYPGTLTAGAAAQREKELNQKKEVKRLIKARDLFAVATKFKERRKIELAIKRFEKVVRVYGDTKYGDLAKRELATLKK